MTRAEKTGYESTSTYQDVMTFLGDLVKTSSFIRIDALATTAEGKNIPLLVIGNPLPESLEGLKNDGRLVIYIQAGNQQNEGIKFPDADPGFYFALKKNYLCRL